MALGKTLGELREEMSSAELTLWREYWKLDPKNEHRADLRNAALMQLVHEFARQGKGASRDLQSFIIYDPERARRKKAEAQFEGYGAQEIKHRLLAAFGRR